MWVQPAVDLPQVTCVLAASRAQRESAASKSAVVHKHSGRSGSAEIAACVSCRDADSDKMVLEELSLLPIHAAFISGRTWSVSKWLPITR